MQHYVFNNLYEKQQILHLHKLNYINDLVKQEGHIMYDHAF